MTAKPEFGPSQFTSILRGLGEIKSRTVGASHPAFAFDKLEQLWRFGDFDPQRRPAFRLSDADWFLGMSDEFSKAITHIDRRLQGRVLEAISKILADPTSAKGNTIRPLTGDLKDLWRYRIGDYRIVYQPNIDRRQVLLVAFTTRDQAYS